MNLFTFTRKEILEFANVNVIGSDSMIEQKEISDIPFNGDSVKAENVGKAVVLMCKKYKEWK